MFGRGLIMQVHDDAAGTDRSVPLIVEKCIEAVEAIGKPRATQSYHMTDGRALLSYGI